MLSLHVTIARIQIGIGFAVMATSICVLGDILASGEEVKPGKDGHVEQASASLPKKPGKKALKKPTGPELYALHCNRCHAERYAPERTAEQWKTILLHMRTRANLPAAQAREILKYLQEQGGQ